MHLSELTQKLAVKTVASGQVGSVEELADLPRVTEALQLDGNWQCNLWEMF